MYMYAQSLLRNLVKNRWKIRKNRKKWLSTQNLKKNPFLIKKKNGIYGISQVQQKCRVKLLNNDIFSVQAPWFFKGTVHEKRAFY